jgi:hypothetical protein
MAPARSIWTDIDLLDRVCSAQRALSKVAGLTSKATHEDWDWVVARIREGRLSEEEKEQARAASSDFFVDVVELNQLPRAFDELHDALHRDFAATTLTTMVEHALTSVPERLANLKAIVRKTNRLLAWRVIVRCAELVAICRNGESWQPKLMEWAEPIANPDPVFVDLDELRRAGAAWLETKKNLRLDRDEEYITQDDIYQARQQLTTEAMSRWPEAMERLHSRLMDEQQAPRLHRTLRSYVVAEVEGRFREDRPEVRREPKGRLIKEAFSESLLTVVWRSTKMAASWSESLAVDDLSWARFVFNHLAEDARKALNRALMLPSGYDPERDERLPETGVNLHRLPERRSPSADLLRQVWDALPLPPDRENAALMMRFGRDLRWPGGAGFDAIAQELGVSRDSATKLVQRAVSRLRNQFGESDENR